MTKQLLLTSVVAITGLLGTVVPAHDVKSTPCTDTSLGTTGDVASFVLGYSFTVNAKNITVDKLGYFDAEKDGLLTSHDVGIFLTINNSLIYS